MKFTLGTVQFGMKYGVANTADRVSFEEAKLIVGRARQLGIMTLDTAVSYGESESVLGKIDVGSFKLITKISEVPVDSKNINLWIKSQINKSLLRLKINQIEGLLLHRPNQLNESIGPEVYETLQYLKVEGLVKKIGISIYGVAELDPLIGRYEFDIVQAPLNILDRSLVESGWALRLKKLGVEVHTRSAFMQGLLLIPKDKRPVKFARWNDIWTEWDTWLAAEKLTPLQACLRYANELDCIDQCIVGVDSVAQLNEIFDAATGQLPSLPQFKKMQDDRLINPATWNQL